MTAFAAGVTVTCVLDADKRRTHAKLHSAGHLLDIAMSLCGKSELTPTKGNHAPGSAYVEYMGEELNGDDCAVLKDALNAKCEELIASKGPVKAVKLSYDEAAEMCGGSLPEYIPKDSVPRIVKMDNHEGCPCGGTHVENMGDIVKINVTKLKMKKDSNKRRVLRVSYEVKGI